MVFSSIMFVFVFLPIVLTFYLLLYILLTNKNNNKQPLSINILNSFLLLASLVFYTWGEPKNIIILLFCTLSNYIIAQFIPHKKFSKYWVTLGIIINIGLLVYYKYAMFIFAKESLDFINSILPDSLYFSTTFNIVLPLGISFYIFQATSYLVDVYRKEVKPAKNLIDFACYLTMFPQLVAGPIVRYSQVAIELKERIITTSSFATGATRFILGLAKKVLIADTLGKVADSAFAVPTGELPMYAAWAGIICYTFQIYYDFSGYSDMAIGMGKMFGFKFPENFNYPYIADSIKDFWRRWHISLSTWFKDYLYIPLGGNRKSPLRTYFNLFIVFLLCGFWHGASWNFLAWGAYYGLFLVMERIFPSFPAHLPRIFRHIYALLIIILGWVLFKADSLSHAYGYYQFLLGIFDSTLKNPVINLNWNGNDVDYALLIAVIFATPLYRIISEKINKYTSISEEVYTIGKLSYYVVILLIFVSCVYPIFGASYKAFIYFRF